jgi:demethylmenaquinone methyltransferase/2-methoxy-6-polyprenyl-1,4-benzoquinol methylase
MVQRKMNTTDNNDGSGAASFGYRAVAEEERQGLVNQVFAKVAASYDQMNDLMSAGLHRLWKDDFVALLNPPHSGRRFEVLDVAGGTGDIALRIAATGGSGTHVTVADISAEMIAEGARRARSHQHGSKCRYSVANAEALPFEASHFDAYTIAFGIRNVTHIDKALSEAYRVLKPGGRFLCLEFSHVDVPGIEQVYEAYSMAIIPAIGKVVTGDGEPYRYLVESIRKFPSPTKFENMIAEAGFVHTSHRLLTAGVVAIHSGWKA